MWELSLSQAFFQFVKCNIELLMTRMESITSHGAERAMSGRERTFFFSPINLLYYFFPSSINILWSWIKTEKKCKCPNSVHLESIVEKEEKLINWRSGKQVLFFLNSSPPLSPPFSHLPSPSPFCPSCPQMPCLLQRVPRAFLPLCLHHRCCLWQNSKSVIN